MVGIVAGIAVGGAIGAVALPALATVIGVGAIGPVAGGAFAAA